MENGHSKKKIFIVLGVLIILIAAVIVIFMLRQDDDEIVSFDANDEAYFKIFDTLFESSDEYKFESLDAYYLKDSEQTVGRYFYHGVYSFYFDGDGKWYKVDEVYYGGRGDFDNSYCLSWDSIEGFEQIDEEFQRAQKEGIHKTYTEEDICRLNELYGAK